MQTTQGTMGWTSEDGARRRGGYTTMFRQCAGREEGTANADEQEANGPHTTTTRIYTTSRLCAGSERTSADGERRGTARGLT